VTLERINIEKQHATSDATLILQDASQVEAL